jgi:50S ribosomal subunit-associated GTPase HflX
VTRRPEDAPGLEPERGFVLAVLAREATPATSSPEVEELARTAGVEAVATLTQHRARPAQRTYVGKGKIEELKAAYKERGARACSSTTSSIRLKQRFLENALQARVVDRTQLILDIFAQHAVSAEGKLQVELAQLEYNLPRMRGMWQHLERLGGGAARRRASDAARRVAARERPPDGAAPHLAAPAPPQGSRDAAPHAPEGAHASRDAASSRSPATRTSASPRS